MKQVGQSQYTNTCVTQYQNPKTNIELYGEDYYKIG